MSTASERYTASMKLPTLDLGEIVASMSTGGISATYRDAVLARGGAVPDPYHVQLPLAMLSTRDMTAAGVSGSNYLVATENQRTIDALAPVSACVAAGCQVVTGLQGNATLPRISSAAAGYWLAGEAAQITESQPTLGQISMTPKTAGAITQYSLMMAKQAPDFDRMLRAELARTIGALIDQAMISGSGQPLGLVGTPGIGSQSGASLDWSGILEMRRLVRVANGAEASTAWILDPATAKLLSGRAVISGGTDRTILQDGMIDNRPAIVSTNVPASTAILADWSTVLLAVWQPSLEFAVDPYGDFSRGIASVRAMISIDCAATLPAAVVKAESIT